MGFYYELVHYAYKKKNQKFKNQEESLMRQLLLPFWGLDPDGENCEFIALDPEGLSLEGVAV